MFKVYPGLEATGLHAWILKKGLCQERTPSWSFIIEMRCRGLIAVWECGQISGDKCLSQLCLLHSSILLTYTYTYGIVSKAPQRPHTDPDLFLLNWDLAISDSRLAPFRLPDLYFQIGTVNCAKRETPLKYSLETRERSVYCLYQL